MAPWDPTKNKTYQILKAAEEGGYGVQAPIAYNLEHILAFIAAAEAKRSPLIIQVFLPFVLLLLLLLVLLPSTFYSDGIKA